MGREPAHQFYDEIADVYDSRYENDFCYLYDDITWKNLRRFLPLDVDSLILDAGAGTGYAAVPLASMGYRVVMVDISTNMLRLSEKRLRKERLLDRVDIVVADLRNLKMFPDELFDLVICQGSVLSCIERYEKAFKELARVAKTDSYVNVSVHHRFGWVDHFLEQGKVLELKAFLEHGQMMWVEGNFTPHPLHAFTVDELTALFTRLGLEPVRLIGKVVFPQHLVEAYLPERSLRDRILHLAMHYADVPQFLGHARYIDIVGLKR